MDNLVIFSSPLMCGCIAAIVVLHILSAFIPPLIQRGKNYDATSKVTRLIVWLCSGINAILHLVVIAYAMTKHESGKTSPEELLLFVMISATVAMVSLSISSGRPKKK